MSALVIAQQINTFAQNPATQSLIVGDENMLTTLLNFLKDEGSDNATLLQCVEAFNALAKNSACRDTVNGLNGLLLRLADLCDSEDASIAAMSKSALDHLSGNAEKKEKVTLPTVNTVRAGAFGSRGYVYNTLLHVPKMSTEAQRTEIEAAVLKAKGIVSVNIDSTLRNVNIYSSVKAEEFAPQIIQVIAECGFTATHVNGKADTKASKPGYAKNPNCAAEANKEALVRYVDKDKAGAKKGENGWLNGISSYFW